MNPQPTFGYRQSPASLAAEEQLKKPSSHEGQADKAGKGGVIFWGILGLVVVVLLIVISRLLPKSSSPSP